MNKFTFSQKCYFWVLINIYLWTQNPLLAILSLLPYLLNLVSLVKLNVNFLALIYLVIYVGAVCFVPVCPDVLNLRSYDLKEKSLNPKPFAITYLLFLIIYFRNIYYVIETKPITENLHHIIFGVNETPLITNYLLNNPLLFLTVILLLFIAIISPVLLSTERAKIGHTLDFYTIFVRKNETVVLINHK